MKTSQQKYIICKLRDLVSKTVHFCICRSYFNEEKHSSILSSQNSEYLGRLQVDVTQGTTLLSRSHDTH